MKNYTRSNLREDIQVDDRSCTEREQHVCANLGGFLIEAYVVDGLTRIEKEPI